MNYEITRYMICDLLPMIIGKIMLLVTD